MHYKVVYHVGGVLALKTRANSGTLTFQDESVCISGTSVLTVPYSSVTGVEMVCLYGLGSSIKLVCRDRIIFLTVVRLNFFGCFIIVNFFKAVELYETLKRKLPTTV